MTNFVEAIFQMDGWVYEAILHGPDKNADDFNRLVATYEAFLIELGIEPDALNGVQNLYRMREEKNDPELMARIEAIDKWMEKKYGEPDD